MQFPLIKNVHRLVSNSIPGSLTQSPSLHIQIQRSLSKHGLQPYIPTADPLQSSRPLSPGISISVSRIWIFCSKIISFCLLCARCCVNLIDAETTPVYFFCKSAPERMNRHLQLEYSFLWFLSGLLPPLFYIFSHPRPARPAKSR